MTNPLFDDLDKRAESQQQPQQQEPKVEVPAVQPSESLVSPQEVSQIRQRQ